MEIVRQRKKRLLAWILTLVLCVGMWQGNVQASDVTEGGIPGKTVININNIEKTDKFKCSATYSISEGDQTKEVTIEEAFSIDNINSNSSLTVVGKTVLGDDAGTEFEHRLLKWEVVDGNNKILDSKTREEDSDIHIITPPSSVGEQSSWSWENVSCVNLTWEKILVITHTYIENGERKRSTKTYYQTTPEQTTVEIDLPVVEMVYNGRKFFKEWLDPTSSGSVIEGDKYTTEFGRLYEEREVHIETNYDSETVPISGTYLLSSDEIYVLGNSDERWTVTSGTQSDGYEYEGGISFVGPGVEYSYKKINWE